MTFIGNLTLDLDVACDLSDPAKPELLSVEFGGVNILGVLKRKEKQDLVEQCLKCLKQTPTSYPNHFGIRNV